MCSGLCYCNFPVVLRESNGKPWCPELWALGVIRRVCHCDLKLLWSEHTVCACNNCSSTLLSYHSYLGTLPKKVNPPETRNGKEKSNGGEKRNEMGGGWMKERRTESGWWEGRSEIRVLVFDSQNEYRGVKCEADVAAWSGSRWKALAASVATCWLLIENSGLPLGNRFLLFSFSKRARSCWVMFLDWYRRVGVT